MTEGVFFLSHTPCQLQYFAIPTMVYMPSIFVIGVMTILRNLPTSYKKSGKFIGTVSPLLYQLSYGTKNLLIARSYTTKTSLYFVLYPLWFTPRFTQVAFVYICLLTLLRLFYCGKGVEIITFLYPLSLPSISSVHAQSFPRSESLQVKGYSWCVS